MLGAIAGTDPSDCGSSTAPLADGLIISVKDGSGRFVLVNNCFESTFHLRRGDILGNNEEHVFPPDTAKRHRAADLQVLASQSAVEGDESITIDGTSRRFLSVRFPVGSEAAHWLGVAAVSAALRSGAGTGDDTVHLLRDRMRREGAFLLDDKGNILSWNGGSQRLFGYPEAEVLSRNSSMLYAPEEVVSGTPVRTLQAARKEQVHESEAWHVTRDRSRFRAHIVLASLASSGTSEGYIEVAGSVSPEEKPQGKRTEVVGTQPPGWSNAVLDSIPAHVAILDRAGTIIHVNEAWRRFAEQEGIARICSAVIGANYLDLCSEAADGGAEVTTNMRAGIAAVLAGHEDAFCAEYTCRAGDLPLCFLITVTRLKTPEGGAVVLLTDISRRMVAEQMLRRSSDLAHALFENASDLVAIVDPHGAFQSLSPSVEKVLGFKQTELLGKKFVELANPDDASRMTALFSAASESGAVTAPVRFSLRHKHGGWRILDATIRNTISDPAVGGIVITARDITERVIAESELLEKDAALRDSNRTLQAVAAKLIEAEERERRRLSRELHDDLNQQLAMLSVDAGGLARSLPGADPKRIEEELRALQGRLTQICGQVRTMAYQLHPSVLDDLGLVVAVRSYCAEFTRREGIQTRFFHRNFPARLPQEQASTIYRIIQEALRNAARHSQTNAVSVSLIGSDRELALIVRDRGCGFSVDKARARGGLGLTSMEERARLAGGTLTITSRPGKGTTVSVRIPRSAGVVE